LTDDVATTEARPTELGLGAVLADGVRPLDLVEAGLVAGELVAAAPAAVGPVRVTVRPLLAGTPTTGTEVRTVGSDSDSLTGVVAPVAGVDFGVGVGGDVSGTEDGVLPVVDVPLPDVPLEAVLLDLSNPVPAVTAAVETDDDDAPGRMTLVGDSSTSPPEVCAPPAALVVGSSGVSGASVEAPTAPDFACVSVIDQSCSLGCTALCRSCQLGGHASTAVILQPWSFLRRTLDEVIRFVRVTGDRH
jgi:hypothetical protein